MLSSLWVEETEKLKEHIKSKLKEQVKILTCKKRKTVLKKKKRPIVAKITGRNVKQNVSSMEKWQCNVSQSIPKEKSSRTNSEFFKLSAHNKVDYWKKKWEKEKKKKKWEQDN